MKKIGALWLKESQSTGRKFFAGVLELQKLSEEDIGEDEKVKIAIFRNEGKEGNQPDYNVCLSNPPEGGGGGGRRRRGPSRKSREEDVPPEVEGVAEKFDGEVVDGGEETPF